MIQADFFARNIDVTRWRRTTTVAAYTYYFAACISFSMFLFVAYAWVRARPDGDSRVDLLALGLLALLQFSAGQYVTERLISRRPLPHEDLNPRTIEPHTDNREAREAYDRYVKEAKQEQRRVRTAEADQDWWTIRLRSTEAFVQTSLAIALVLLGGGWALWDHVKLGVTGWSLISAPPLLIAGCAFLLVVPLVVSLVDRWSK
jgi:hypothetical protein